MKGRLVRKIITVISLFMAGILYTATVITEANAKNISSVFGAKTFDVVNENLSDDAVYYESKYDSLEDLINDGHDTAKQVLEEGAVLLKNNNNALPLAKGNKVSLVGVNSYDPVYGGTGSGIISTNDVVDFVKSMENAGLEVNPTLQEAYTSEDWQQYKRSNDSNFGDSVLKINEAPWDIVKEAAGDSFVQYGDAAIFSVGRVGGEGYDLNNKANDGVDNGDGLGNDYLGLNANELSVLEGLKEKKAAGEIKKIVVLINYAGMLEGDFLKDEAIDAALWVGALGVGGNAIGELFTGDATPSGRLPDTMWMNNAYNPVNVNYGAFIYDNAKDYKIPTGSGTGMYPEVTLGSYVVYQEGMYLGYRYTETRYEDKVLGTANVGDFNYNDVVAYPFGYGLSYADFQLSNTLVEKTGDREYTVSVDVKNISDTYSGKCSVPVYVSKPYGEYAKTNGIQVPSVELVNFEKTKELAPGESQTVKVVLDEKYFASYDANNAKGYVLMDGDYYVAVGGNAHEAVNNVLAAKQSNGVAVNAAEMIGSGDSSRVAKFALTFDKDKYVYSDAESMLEADTHQQVTNLFDFADINKYEGRGDNHVDYYSRDNWSAVSLDMLNGHATVDMTEQMAKDIYAQVPEMTGQYNNVAGVPDEYQQPIPKDDGDYPEYGKDNDLKLIDMRYDEDGNEISFFDPKWDDFMDQLTWDETMAILGNAFHVTEPVESVAKPGTKDENGPNGFGGWAFTNGYYTGRGLAYRNEAKAGNINEDGTYSEKADQTGYAKMTGFPANGIMAATFNKELANKAGEIIGEDGLWAGCSGLYGLGMNIHRSPYLGRTCEYYSECGTLTGIIGAAETKGIQSKGVNVYSKHCALNDQENRRYGVACWINEQALREIYLRGFEMPITDGGAFNTMASLSRFGIQAGAGCKALAEDFLRGECGMRGIIVTDAYGDMNGSQNIDPYFEMVYGIYYGGSDVPDGWQPLTEGHYEKFKKGYSKMAWQMRNAAKRVMYQTAWSSAMNGLDENSEIEKVVPGWLKVLKLADKIVYVIFAVFAIWTLIDVVGDEKKRLQQKKNN